MKRNTRQAITEKAIEVRTHAAKLPHTASSRETDRLCYGHSLVWSCRWLLIHFSQTAHLLELSNAIISSWCIKMTRFSVVLRSKINRRKSQRWPSCSLDSDRSAIFCRHLHPVMLAHFIRSDYHPLIRRMVAAACNQRGRCDDMVDWLVRLVWRYGDSVDAVKQHVGRT